PSLRSRSIKIAGGVHHHLALWVGAIGSIEGAKPGQRSIGRETKDRAGINLSAKGGCAIKVAIVANRQPGLWARAVREVEGEQRRQYAMVGDPENCPGVVGAALSRRSVKISVRAQDKSSLRMIAHERI